MLDCCICLLDEVCVCACVCSKVEFRRLPLETIIAGPAAYTVLHQIRPAAHNCLRLSRSVHGFAFGTLPKSCLRDTNTTEQSEGHNSTC